MIDGLAVTLYAGSEDGKYFVEVAIQDYVEVPDDFKPAIALLGLEEDQFNVVPDSQYLAGYVFVQLPIEDGTSEADAIQAYIDIIAA